MAETATPVRDAHSSGAEEGEHAPPSAGAALDLLLTEAGLGTRERFLPGRDTVRLVTGLARRPGRVVRRGSALTVELAKVVAGRSEHKPPAATAGSSTPPGPTAGCTARLLQAYLAVDETVDGARRARARGGAPRAASRRRPCPSARGGWACRHAARAF
jgi:hypothetical protein